MADEERGGGTATAENADGGGDGGGSRELSPRLQNALRALNEVSTLANASEQLLRDRVAQLAGLQYGKKRDVWKVAGYPEDYTFTEGWTRYRRQDVVRRIVDLPVDRTWKHKPVPLLDEEPDTPWGKAWQELWADLKMQPAMRRADVMASIGEYSVIFLGFDDAATDEQLKQPVAQGSGRRLVYVRPYKQDKVSIQTWEDDVGEERYGLPKIYRIQVGSSQKGRFPNKALNVHWSRVLHVVEDPLESEVYGMPVLERCLNRLIDLEKVAASTGEAYWQLIVPILKAIVDPDSGMKKGDRDDLEDALLDMVHDLRRHFIGAGIDLEYLESDHAPDPSDAAHLYFMLIAAARGIPMRVLFGTETGERASQQDERAFLSLIEDRQEQHAEPHMVQAWTDRMIWAGVLSPPEGELTWDWPDLYQATEEEQAEANKTRAETAKTLTPVGGDPSDVAEVTDDGDVLLIPSSRRRKPTPPEPDPVPPPEGEEEEEEEAPPEPVEEEEAADDDDGEAEA